MPVSPIQRELASWPEICYQRCWLSTRILGSVSTTRCGICTSACGQTRRTTWWTWVYYSYVAVYTAPKDIRKKTEEINRAGGSRTLDLRMSGESALATTPWIHYWFFSWRLFLMISRLNNTIIRFNIGRTSSFPNWSVSRKRTTSLATENRLRPDQVLFDSLFSISLLQLRYFSHIASCDSFSFAFYGIFILHKSFDNGLWLVISDKNRVVLWKLAFSESWSSLLVGAKSDDCVLPIFSCTLEIVC